jgi:thioredoxin reductase/ferredoxin
MLAHLRRYTHWLHTRWPAGTVEKLPVVEPDGSTAVPGLYVVGDLCGIPLLKFSADTGAKAVRTIHADVEFQRQRAGKPSAVRDLVILGGGVSGMAAALEAKKLRYDFVLLEAAEPFSTIANFPKGKPIYTYPQAMVPAGEIQFAAQVKEPLLVELRAQTLDKGIVPQRARAERVERRGEHLAVVVPDGDDILACRVIVAIGRSGNFRKLGVPGEDLGKVSNRLHDPSDYADKDVLVVGGGDSAIEAAIAIAKCGGKVTLSYRKKELARPKPENLAQLEALRVDPMADVAVEAPTSERVGTPVGAFMEDRLRAGRIDLQLGSTVKGIADDTVTLTRADGKQVTIENDAVFAMIGREAPLEFFRKSGVPIRGELRARHWVALAAFVLLCTFIYNWKAGGVVYHAFEQRGWFPFGVNLGALAADPATLLGTLAITLRQPSFYYSLAYCVCVVLFGIARIRRRQTPYIKVQTLTLMAVQVVPLFLLPYLVLPWLGHAGAFDAGAGRAFADALFPVSEWDKHGREYWRAFGFILAWPLFVWNFFTPAPMTAWLVIGLVQTFVLIPLLVRKWGKGAYCGWICSCGALAETLGDTHRSKMPHGPKWNRLNLVGQVILAAALLLFALRIVSWTWPHTSWGSAVASVFHGALNGFTLWGVQLNYYWIVDVLLAGIVGVGFYFWFSGRVWCRFACPLAALMHIYARFSRFRILPEKKKCISCNVCTSVCHQGIDIMSFANKGLPMSDPECVRCSACVQSCPTGVLEFGEIDLHSGATLRTSWLPASPVRMREQAAPKPAPVRDIEVGASH